MLTCQALSVAVPAQREWKYFEGRESSLLKPDHQPRDPATVDFPLSDHATTKPVLAGRLNRKSTMLKRQHASYYVLTPSGFLHEYKDADATSNPEPTLSLKLADCDLLNPPEKSGKAGFKIKGKDKGKAFGGMTHEYSFKTDSMEEATKWWEKINHFIGCVVPAMEESSSPTSPMSTSTIHSTQSPTTEAEHQAPQATEKPTEDKGAAPATPARTDSDGSAATGPTATTAAPTDPAHAAAKLAMS